MISQAELDRQLAKISYKMGVWGRAEIRELADVLATDEKLSQLVNGYYENGFALLAATDHRMLLIDKKPFNFLNVEDFRFDMINQLDYNHRLFNSSINVSAGPKNLHFTSYNQKGLRELLNGVQCRMIEIKEDKKRSAEQQQVKLDRLDRTLKQYIEAQLLQSASGANSWSLNKGGNNSSGESSDKLADERLQKIDDDWRGGYIKTGSLLPGPKVDLVAAKIVFAKLPWVISRRRRHHSV